MSSAGQLTILETRRDRYAREAQLRLGPLLLPAPSFGVLVKSREEFELFLRMQSVYSMDRVRSCTVRMFDSPSLILPRIQETQQITIDGRPLDEDFGRFLRDTLVLVDPALEYLFYEFHLSKFTSSKLIPTAIREYVRRCESKKISLPSDEYSKWKEAFHRLFWNEVYEDPKRRVQLVGETIDLELRLRAKVTLAPSPIVDSTNSLAIAAKMNEVTQELSRSRAAEPSTYLTIHKSTLGDDRLMDEITSYVERAPTRLTILKFKRLDLTESARISEREAYRELLLQLALMRQKDPSRGFVLLEAENQTFPSATVAFDIVNTSFTGQDKDSSFGHTPYGKWYDPKEMMQRDYSQVQRMFRVGGLLPHGCPICRGVVNLDSLLQDEWYRVRRIHYCYCMQEFMRMIARAIDERNIELAREKIVNSSISVLKSLIPRI